MKSSPPFLQEACSWNRILLQINKTLLKLGSEVEAAGFLGSTLSLCGRNLFQRAAFGPLALLWNQWFLEAAHVPVFVRRCPCSNFTLHLFLLPCWQRIIESSKSLAGRVLKDHPLPNPRPQAGTIFMRQSCLKPHPTCPRTLPGMRHLLGIFQVWWILVSRFANLCL